LSSKISLPRVAKRVFARVDEATDVVWVRYDHLAASWKKQFVFRESQWVRFEQFFATNGGGEFPRSQRPFRNAWLRDRVWYDQACLVENPDVNLDDAERPNQNQNPDDMYDEDDDLDWKRQDKVVDKDRTTEYWMKRFAAIVIDDSE
jgi:hypothetical protein